MTKAHLVVSEANNGGNCIEGVQTVDEHAPHRQRARHPGQTTSA